MRKQNKQVAAGAMRGLVAVAVVAVGIAASVADAAEKPTLEAIRARIQEQWSKVHSLHLRVRQETTLSVEPYGNSAWPSKLIPPAFLGTEDVLFALDGDKRYVRSLGLDRRAIGSPGSRPADDAGQRRTHDQAWAWNGKTLRERTKGAGGRFQHRVLAGFEAVGHFPSPQYVMDCGFAVPDPTAGREVNDRLGRTWFLPEVLRSPRYIVADATDAIDGSRCIVIECRPGSVDSSSAEQADLKDDKMWLDLEHGLALRKREFKVDDRLARVANEGFVEVAPALWLPQHSRIEEFVACCTPEQYQRSPLLACDMRLACHVVNEVPAELFDVALTERPRPRRRSLFEVVRTYHWCERTSEDGSQKEVWASKDLGRREEIRWGGELQLLRIDTPAWSLLWRPSLNRAMLLPTRLADLLDEDAGTLVERGTNMSYSEELTAMFQLQEDQLNGKEVDKVTAYYPADPQVAGDWPIHGFDPEMQRKVPGTQMRSRTYWFDHKTRLMVQRRCGCKSPKYDTNADYPPPESARPEHFAFQLPQGARLESADEKLERLFRSQQ